MQSSSLSYFSPSNPEDLFTDFYSSGQQESSSPFIKADSRSWSINLTLKASLLASFCLALSFAFSFIDGFMPLSHLLLVAVYFLAGIPSLIEAVQDLAEGDINIDILMTIAAFSSIFIGSGMEGGLLLVLFALSGAMEDAVTNKAKGALTNLHKLSPTRACVIQSDGRLIEKAINDISIGTRILVKASQVIPLDGIVIEGTSSVNLVHLTGENLPVTKTIGDEVPSGGRNLEGALVVEVNRLGSDSTLARIITLVTQAQEARPILQRWFDKVSRTYAISIISLALLLALVMPYFLSIPFLGVEGSIYRALAFLIAASPCALIIAIPIAYLSAVSACAKAGILIKGGISLDALASCRSVAFDKTGTLTSGELTFLAIEPIGANDTIGIKTAMSAAFTLEKNANHPIASAIMRYAQEKEIKPLPITSFKEIPGYGLEGILQLPQGSQKAFIGRLSYILEQIPSNNRENLLKRQKEIQEAGELLAVLTIGTQPYIIRFRDQPRPKVIEMLKAIKKRGWSTVMLTGDHHYSAKKIADELKIDTLHADLTPEEKMHYVTVLSKTKGLAMIGDGVNDAPALARATVGICMGKAGSTAAVDAADVILLHDNIELLDWLIGKAKQTQNVVRQNLIIASAAILVAALPALGGLVPLWLAVLLHEGGTVLVGFNAMRLLGRQKDEG